jgi:NAD(P)-dependent dehydrogenase (short-subunit alcohol dehydrogenase family)
MAKLSPKGDRNNDAMPLGRWGDGGGFLFGLIMRELEGGSEADGRGCVAVIDEIAAMALFLFSDSANWITGQVFVSRRFELG